MSSWNLQMRTKGPCLMESATASRIAAAQVSAISGSTWLALGALLMAATVHLAAQNLTSLPPESPTELPGAEQSSARTVEQQSLIVALKNKVDSVRTFYLLYQVQQSTALASKSSAAKLYKSLP